MYPNLGYCKYPDFNAANQINKWQYQFTYKLPIHTEGIIKWWDERR